MADESIAVAIYKLGMDNQQYIAAAQRQLNVNDQLVASQEKVAISEEKAGGASLLAANAMQRRIERNTEGAIAERKFAEAMAFSARAAQEGRATAEQRAIFLEQETAKLNTARAAIEAKAKAQRDAAQAEREAEAAAKNLARIEGEHALALKNTAAALGVDQAALIAAANAGNRNAAATLDMMNKIVGLNKELQAGNLNLITHAKEVDRVQQGYRSSVTAIATQEAAMRKSSTVTGLARHELINLSRQFQDITVSLAGGQSPFRILIEQGSQILDVFASSKAVFGEVFRNMIAWAARAVTSVLGVATALAAIGLAGGAAAIRWLDAQREIDKSLVGLGRGAGVTTAEVTKIAEAASKTTRLSTASAREAAIEFINTGKIYKENLQGAIELVDKFALVTGTTAAEAQKELAKQLSGGMEGVIALNARFGFLNASEVENIRILYSQRKEQEAIALTMQKLLPVLTRGADLSSEWARGWMATTKALSELVDVIGKTTAGIVDLIRQSAPLKDIGPSVERRGVGGRAFAQGRPEDTASTRLAGVTADEAQRSILSLAAANVTLGTSTEKATVALTAEEERLRLIGLQADAATKSVFPQIDAINALTDKLSTLKKAQEDAEAAGLSDAQTKNLRDATSQVELLKRQQEESFEASKRQTDQILKIANAYKNALGAGKGLTVETALQVRALDDQIKVQTARNRGEIERAARQEKINALMLQGKSYAEAELIVNRQMSLVHATNMNLLEGQLSVAQARTGIAKINAQYENDINQRLREGATLAQAIAEAEVKRRTAIENANTAVAEQIHQLEQQTALLNARSEADERSLKAAQAYENAIRSGADATHAAALQAAVLANELARAAKEARRPFEAGAFIIGAPQGRLGSVSTGFSGGPLVGSAGMSTSYTLPPGALGPFIPNPMDEQIRQAAIDAAIAASKANIPGYPEYAAKQAQLQQAQQDAASAQQAAADEAARAAQAQIEAAEEMRKAIIASLDVNAPNAVATRLMAGQSAQQVNQLIEQGEIQFGTSQQRFETQLDLYKRAGMSNAQIAADIRAGLIGEAVQPTELLAALDSLEEAVNSNTAAQLGLSDFYTQQGDRLVGYRGLNVQTGLRPTATGGTGAGAGTGTLAGGMPGATVTPPGQVAYEVTHPPIPGSSGAPTNNYYYYYPPPSQQVPAPAPVVTSTSTYKPPTYTQQQLPIGSYGPSVSPWYTGFQHGGIVDRPTFGVFGEAGPEAVIPLSKKYGVNDTILKAIREWFESLGYTVLDRTTNPTGAFSNKDVMARNRAYYQAAGYTVLDQTTNPTGAFSNQDVMKRNADYYRSHGYTVLGAFGGAPFAEGGVVSRPTVAMVGEAGPEAIVPLKDGAVPVEVADRSVTAFGAAFAAALEQHFPVTNVWPNLTSAIDDLVNALPPGDVHFPVTSPPYIPGVTAPPLPTLPVVTGPGPYYPGVAPGDQHFPIIGGYPGAKGIPIGPTGFAEGGVAYSPQMGIFGEAGPEAFVPLRGGAIPVKLMGKAANNNVININAPLVHFAAEPTRDEVRESAFQAAQMLRRVAMG